MDTEPEIVERPRARHIARIQGQVEFEDVNFSYDFDKPVLKNISFEVKPGEMIGVVGRSGAGKSTLVNLICRFYDVDSGRIVIDGHDSRNICLESLRSQIGMVLQEPFLFNATVAENIAYGKGDASYGDIMAAAKSANAHDFIMRLPDGYNSVVGERGNKFSGGERQRISIARAILRNPPILVLDEATSSIDLDTESQLQEALNRLVETRTTFAIAHRLSTLRQANRLFVIDKGELVESGTHMELLNRDGHYAQLCQLQRKISQLTAW